MTNKLDDLTDEEWRNAILTEHDPLALASLIHGFYHDADRADRASRALMYLHMGMLTGVILRLLADENGKS